MLSIQKLPLIGKFNINSRFVGKINIKSPEIKSL